ncbi:hypothetical protein GXW78_15870 [Roseomonas terrae]|jgi:hypothetical protein|uniref:Lipoprotein n=1 Tax=Neoroseomonas terrae TaxID=424799 RepID=A0ABS5EJF2_9PROT|nr:hypothetical protein [Neoroseomonas terrae]MBR0651150.1 hypothetical protein [Neoroseomonas terrae]
MVRAVALAALATLAACGPRTAAGRAEAGPQFWRPSVTKESWLIGGYMDTRRVPAGLTTQPQHEVFITVNGRVAMQGGMPREHAVELSGAAEGSRLSALCTPRMVARATLQVNCLVLVGNERAATLTFTAGPAQPG